MDADGKLKHGNVLLMRYELCLFFDFFVYAMTCSLQYKHAPRIADNRMLIFQIMFSSSTFRHHARGTSAKILLSKIFFCMSGSCPKDSLNALKSDGTFKGSKITLKDVSYYATQDFENVKSGKILIFYPTYVIYVLQSFSIKSLSIKISLIKMMKKKDYDHTSQIEDDTHLNHNRK